MDVSEAVRDAIHARFVEDDGTEVVAWLQQTELVELASADERDRLQLALVRLSDGELGTFLDFLELATRDWRTVLVTDTDRRHARVGVRA